MALKTKKKEIIENVIDLFNVCVFCAKICAEIVNLLLYVHISKSKNSKN